MIKNLLILFLFPLTVYGQQNNGFLRRQNTNLINNDGIVQLKGVNIGNWLHIEGYMMGGPNSVIGSYEQMYAQITTLTGSSTHADAFFNTWYQNFFQQKDVDSLAALGYNHVRIPFPFRFFLDTTTNTLKNDGFTYLDNAISWCKAKNMYAILDLHYAPGGQNNSELWSNYAVNKDRTVRIWKHIAQHYATETAVGGYDLLNEPVIQTASEQWKLKDLYQACATEIRSVDNNHVLFLEGNWYASSFWELTDGTPSTNDRWDENIALSPHVYWVPVPSSTIHWSNYIATAMDIPSWVGEAGENSNHWLAKHNADCLNKNTSWCFWSYKKAGSISAIFSNPLNTDYQACVNYWNGTAAQPSAAIALNGLNTFAQECNTSYCTSRPDVSDALLRSDFLTTSKPYKPHSLPLSIPAVEYDMGANSVAYQDNVYQSEGQGSSFTAWNDDWVYRNDGVDIQTWTGSPTIGNISNGEWLGYTVSVPQAGTYRILLEIATTGSNCKVRIDNNGTTVIPAQTLANTGWWATWQNQNMGTITLSATTSTQFKIVAETGGFNLKSVKFELLSVLPVEFLSPYRAYSCSEGVAIEWTTTNEINSQLFEIEHSENAIHFEKIQTILAKNNGNSLNNYRAIDKDPIKGMNYYRIKQVDLDGKSVLTPILSVDKSDFDITIAPNPVKDELRITSDKAIEKVIFISMLGQIVKEIENPSDRITVSDLDKGVYFLAFLTQNGKNYLKKIVIE